MVGKARSSASWNPPRPTVTTKKGGRQVQLSVSLKSRGAPQHLSDGRPVPSQLWFATKAGEDEHSKRARDVHIELLNYLLGHKRWEQLSPAGQHLCSKHFADFPAPAPEELRSGDYLVRVRDRWIGERVARSEVPANLSSAAPSEASSFMPAGHFLPAFEPALLASATLGPAGFVFSPNLLQQLPPATMPPALTHLSTASIVQQQAMAALQPSIHPSHPPPPPQQQQQQQQPAERHPLLQQKQSTAQEEEDDKQQQQQQQQQPSEQQQRQLQLLDGLGSVVAREAGTDERKPAQQQPQQHRMYEQSEREGPEVAAPPRRLLQVFGGIFAQQQDKGHVKAGPDQRGLQRRQQLRWRPQQQQQQQQQQLEEQPAGEPHRWHYELQQQEEVQQSQAEVHRVFEECDREWRDDSEVAQILQNLKSVPVARQETAQPGSPRLGEAGQQGMPEIPRRSTSPDGPPCSGEGADSGPAAGAGKQGPGQRSVLPSLRLTVVGSNSGPFAEAAAAAVKEHDDKRARTAWAARAASTGFDVLSDCLIRSIFEHLGVRDLLQRAALVCRRFREVGYSEELWQRRLPPALFQALHGTGQAWGRHNQLYCAIACPNLLRDPWFSQPGQDGAGCGAARQPWLVPGGSSKWAWGAEAAEGLTVPAEEARMPGDPLPPFNPQGAPSWKPAGAVASSHGWSALVQQVDLLAELQLRGGLSREAACAFLDTCPALKFEVDVAGRSNCVGWMQAYVALDSRAEAVPLDGDRMKLESWLASAATLEALPKQEVEANLWCKKELWARPSAPGVWRAVVVLAGRTEQSVQQGQFGCKFAAPALRFAL